jgi:hypothetical protein
MVDERIPETKVHHNEKAKPCDLIRGEYSAFVHLIVS